MNLLRMSYMETREKPWGAEGRESISTLSIPRCNSAFLSVATRWHFLFSITKHD